VQLVNNAILSFLSMLRSERGQDLLEYAMLSGLVAAAIVVVATILLATGGPVEGMANGIKKCIDFNPDPVTSKCVGGL